MGLRRECCGVAACSPLTLLMGVSALAQSPTYGVGRTPTLRGNPCLGYLHRSNWRRTAAGAGNRQGKG